MNGLYFFPLAALITVSNLLELCDSFQTGLWMFKHGDFHLRGWRTIVYRNCWYVDCERITQLSLSVGTWDVCVLSIKLSSWSYWWRKESETCIYLCLTEWGNMKSTKEKINSYFLVSQGMKTIWWERHCKYQRCFVILYITHPSA